MKEDNHSILAIGLGCRLAGILIGNFYHIQSKFDNPIVNNYVIRKENKIDNFIVDGKIIKTIKGRNELPIGFSIITSNTGKYKWVDQDNYVNFIEYNSKQEAILAAWSWFEYENKKKEEKWKPLDK